MTANGQLADNQLVSFYGVRVAPQAHADAGRMVNAAARVGHVIRPLIVKDGASGYRSVAVQEAMHVAQRTGHAADYHLLPSPPAPPLAPVGYSRHGQGRAIDWVWSSPAAYQWLIDHGAEYNWRFWDRRRDPPHMEHDSVAHDPVTWTEPGLTTSGLGGSVLNNLGGSSMTLWQYSDPNDAAHNGLTALADPVRMTYRYVSGFELDALKQDGAVPHPLGPKDWPAVLAPYREIKTPDPVGGSATADLTPVINAITALDKQADDYQAQLEAILSKGYTVTGIVKPA